MALLEDLPQTPPIGTATLPLEAEDYTRGFSTEDDKLALKIVTQNVRLAEDARSSRRMLTLWDEAERLYSFKVPQMYWSNGMPRASLGMPVVMEHIWSIWPQVMLGLFQDDPPFMSKPRPHISMDAARASDAILGFQLEQCGFKDQIGWGLLTALEYGNALFKYGWKKFTRKTVEYRVGSAARLVTIGDHSFSIPPAQDAFVPVESDETINQPTFEEIEPRHYLIDPGCRYPDPRRAQWVAHILYLTAEKLVELSKTEGYKNLGSPDQILKFFFPPKETPATSAGDSGSSGTIIGVNMTSEFSPERRDLATSVDLRQQPLKVVEYWTASKVYTTIQDKLIIRNEAHNFGCPPFLGFGVVPVKGSYYSFGLSYVIGNEQRLQQGVINGFLDGFSLDLNGMIVRQRGRNILSTQLTMSPGGVIDVDGPVNEGVKSLERAGAPTADVMAVIASSDARAQRRTAANELVVQGSLPSEKSSMTRTATGANLLAGASGARIQGNLIEVIASQVWVPFLEALQKMNGRFLTPKEVKSILSDDLNIEYQKSVADVVNAKVKFSILAAAKLQARRAMANMLPFIMQYFMNEAVLQGMSSQGMKLNFKELTNMVMDVSGWPNRQNLVIPMDQQDTMRSLMNNPSVMSALQSQSQQETQQQNDLNFAQEDQINHAGRDVLKSMMKMMETQHAESIAPSGTKNGTKAGTSKAAA